MCHSVEWQIAHARFNSSVHHFHRRQPESPSSSPLNFTTLLILHSRISPFPSIQDSYSVHKTQYSQSNNLYRNGILLYNRSCCTIFSNFVSSFLVQQERRTNWSQYKKPSPRNRQVTVRSDTDHHQQLNY
ncbi:hypothetical protein H5410_040320 [Solanum commersonii]|uniref:Uncharacterized protein n=1 Tax=Solanum commersonii TaxID=4109 RepID=A0A9J5XS61_SOLCO|nr:hypothetical protein H5410_040320 [Solanum commersonii]